MTGKINSDIINKIKSWEYDKALFNWWNNQPVCGKIAFFSTVIIGFITHIYVYTHRFMNEDDFYIVYDFKRFGSVTSGRWLNNIINYFNYYYTPPIIIGLCAIISIAVLAFLICKIFNISNKINAFLIGGLMATFPAIAQTNGFLYEAAGYFFAALLSTLAFYFTVKYKFGFIIGSIFLMLTMAIYQSKVNIALSLCLFYLIMQLLSEQCNFKDVRNNILKFILLAGLGGTFYMLSVRISLYITDRQLNTYKGINNMGQINFTEIPAMLKTAYSEFYQGFFGDYYISRFLLRSAYVVIGIFALVFIINIIIKYKIYKKPARLISVIFFIICIPLSGIL